MFYNLEARALTSAAVLRPFPTCCGSHLLLLINLKMQTIYHKARELWSDCFFSLCWPVMFTKSHLFQPSRNTTLNQHRINVE